MTTGNTKLLVLIHGWLRTARSMKRVEREITQRYKEYTVIRPECRLLWPLARTDINNAGAHVLAEIETELSKQNYDEIILAGYSCGAIIAQAAFCQAHGADSVMRCNGSFVVQDKLRLWRDKIKRVVLIAGVNRGWSLTSAAPWHTRLFTAPLENAVLFFETLGLRLMIRQIRRGSPFMTTQRLQWLEIARSLRAQKRMPLVVHLIGTKDDLVPPSDCVDPLVGGDIRHIEVPHSTHWQIVNVNDKKHGPARTQLILTAITGDLATIDGIALRPEDADDFFDLSEGGFDFPPPLPDESVKRVVMLVHGIRDQGFWTKKVGVRIKRIARASKKEVRVVSPSYGFFGMGPFFMPRLRFKFVDWLRDHYVTIRALYPEAEICCIAHSNGSYLLMRALYECRAMRFDRVVLAGSVVHRDYDIDRVSPHQIAEIRNYVSSNDCVVATFPRLFEFFPVQDLGSAGHGGFSRSSQVNSRFVDGSHSAALDESRWEEIARFVLREQDAPAAGLIKKQRLRAKVLSLVSPLVWILLAGTIAVLMYALVFAINGAVTWPVAAACAAVAAFVYFLGFVLKSV